MTKKYISKDLHHKLETYYYKCKEEGMDARSILPKINIILKEAGHEGFKSEKSLYNLVNRFNASNTSDILTKAVVKSIDKEVVTKLKEAEAFDLNLSWQNEMIKEMAKKMFNRFIIMEAKGEKANLRDLHETVRITKDLIDSAVKIDALNAKKIDVNSPNTPQMGIFIGVAGQTSKRLEEVTASIVETTQLSEASYG